MKQNVVLSILTPFSSEWAKKWGAAQKTELDKGVPKGSENYYLMLLSSENYHLMLLSSVPFFASVDADMYVFRSRNPFFKVLKK